MRTLTFAAIVLATACISIQAAPPAQRAFATPQEAAHALADAAEANDTAALLKILGPEGKDIVSSGDANDDKAGRAQFARLAAEKLQIRQDQADRNTVVAGSQEWPFPVPLVRGKDGMWRFDSAAGRVEVLARRVGRHELNAIEVCRGYVEAQMEYATHHHDGGGAMQYAQKMVSSPGKQDGLYWEGEHESLVPKSFAGAAAAMFAEGRKPVPYHGYYFHILKAQGPDAEGGAADYVVKGQMIGGFALVAFPAEYGVSGIQTFIVNQRGIVYSKDLGPNTMTPARRMTTFNPDKTWKPAHLE